MTGMDKVVKIVSKKLKTKQMTVTELADAVGCSRQYVYDLIQPKSEDRPNLTVGMAEKFLLACGYKLEITQQETTV
jgi:plasmid maintenance system antidote protein VapI